jgi:hypothetical protein
MEDRPVPSRKGVFCIGLTIALALIMVLGDSAEARRKKPKPDTGDCRCTCSSNQRDSKGQPLGISSLLYNTTSDDCNSHGGNSCVVNAGTSNAMLGTYTHCDWTNTSAPSTSGVFQPPGSPPKGQVGGVAPPVSGGTKQLPPGDKTIGIHPPTPTPSGNEK